MAIKRFVRGMLVLVTLTALLAFVLGYWTARQGIQVFPDNTKIVGTSGQIDMATARQRGAELGQKAAETATRLDQALTDAALTTRIKSKMALDDVVPARTINIDTTSGVVTLRGYVNSEGEHRRAVQLTQETGGVKQVVDRLEVRTGQ